MVVQGDIIYLCGWYLNWFVEQVHDQISSPYILFIGDIGGWFPSPLHQKLLYDPKLAAWFCRNMVFSYHPKLFQTPMGQDLALFHHGKELYEQLISAVVHKDSTVKKHLLHMCFLARAHGDRDKIQQMFAGAPYCDAYHADRPRPLFYQDMASSYFTLSPLGLETDSIRTWEALALGCIPIVEHTFLDPIYKDLPVVIVHDWSEINQPFLEKKREEFKGLKLDKAYFDVWRNELKTVQKKVQEGDLAFAELDASRWRPEDLDDLAEILATTGRLNYKGALTTLRPFELGEKCPQLTIKLHDYWMNRHTFSQLFQHLPTHNVFINAPFEAETSCFLDLTYYRTSLNIDFHTSVCTEGNFRHSLKKDLNVLFAQMDYGSLLIGNQVGDPYVSEVLEQFAKDNEISLQKKGSFWFTIKPKQSLSIEPLLKSYENLPFLLSSSLSPLEPHECAFKPFTENASHIVEVGAWMGCTTRHFAELLPKTGKVLAVYDWKDEPSYQQFLSNIVHAELEDKVVPIRMNSLIAARKLGDISIDLIYIDSTNEPLYEQLTHWYPLVKNHGTLMGNDWTNPEVRKQVQKFAQINNLFLSNNGDLWAYPPSF